MSRGTGPTRWLRMVAHVVLVVFGVVLVLALSTLLALRTPWGADLLTRQLLPRINAEIRGRLEVDRISVSPRRIALFGLSLRDPDGNEVVRATRIVADFSLWGLLRRALEVSSVQIVMPELNVHLDERGQSDLSRALEPRKRPVTSKRSESSEAKQPWRFELEQLTVQGGWVAVTDERASPGTPWRSLHFRVASIRLGGSLFDQDPPRFRLDLDLRGDLEQPLRVPVHLMLAGVSAGTDANGADARASLEVGDSTADLRAQANLDGGLAAADITLEQLRVDPALLREISQASPDVAAILGSGTLAWNAKSGDLRTSLQLGTGAARLTVAARANAKTKSVDGVTFKADNVDLARLIRGAPNSDLSIECQAHGSGTSLEDLDGAITLRMPRGRLDRHVAGPVRLRAEAARGRLRLNELFVSAPGLTVTAAGVATSSAVSAAGTVELHDLGMLLQSLSGVAKGAPAQGTGHLAFTISGSATSPAIRVHGRLAGVTSKDLAIPSLSLGVRVPNARNPLAVDLALRVPEARLGKRLFGGISLRLQGTGPAFALHLALSRPEPVALRVAGRWSSGHKQLAISQAQLTLPQATWKLRRTAALSIGQPRTRLTDLWLASGDQSIGIGFDDRGHDLHARASLSRVDLSLLPQRMLSIPRIGGRLSAELTLRQTRGSRTAKAHLDLSQAHIGTFDPIDSVVDAELSDDRLDARFTLGAWSARAEGQVDLPARWPPQPGAALSADLDVSAIDLERVLAGLAETRLLAHRPMPKLVGAGSAKVKLRGTAGRPDVLLALGFTGLRWQDEAVGDLRVDLDSGRDEGLTARVDLRGPGLGSITLDAHGESRLPSFLTNPNAIRELATLPMVAELHAENVSLSAVATVVGRPGIEAGTARISGRFAGSASDGHGDVTVDIAGFTGPGIPATDGKLHVALRERDVQADMQVTRRQANLLSANATVRAPLAQLVRRGAFADTPVELHATLGPLEWQHVGVVSEVGRPRVLRGRFGAELEVSGTPRRPQAKVRAKTRDARLDDRTAGAADGLVVYEDGLLKAYANVISPDGGRVLATASLKADLGYPAALHLPKPRDLPIDASLQATQFDLAALSGLSPTLRTVAGQVEADLRLSGTVGDPRPSGRLELKDGRLAAVGIGEYENIHLLLHGDRDRLIVDELRADSGAGHVKLTMTASHRDGGYDVVSALDLDKLPVYAQGQPVAAISLHANAKAQIDSGQVHSRVKLESAQVALSDAKRKHLQSLSQPADIILVDRGRPIDKTEKQKLAKNNATLERRPEPGKPATAPATSNEPSIVLLLDAPRDLWLAGKDAHLEIGLEQGFRVEIADQVQVYGRVIVKRGHVDVLGRRFELKESSSLRFSGPPDLPELDVTAQHVNGENNITVVATIMGSPGHLEISLTAPGRPELTESQLYTLVVTGRLGFGSSSSTPSTPADQAQSLLGGLLASQLQTLAANKLPFDVLKIQTGATAGSARVEAGKYVTSDLYVGYVGRIGADPTRLQNRNAVHFEYALGSHWSFQGEYGDAKTGSLDLFWTKRY